MALPQQPALSHAAPDLTHIVKVQLTTGLMLAALTAFTFHAAGVSAFAH